MKQLDAALRYAARGWPVFPCRGKIPLTAHGFRDASMDAATIEAWWRENPDALISVATGRASGVVVLDIDVKHAGPNGWDALEEIGAPLPDTPMASTPSGGTHVFFDPAGARRSALGRQNRRAARRAWRALVLHLADAGNRLSLGPP